jgi:hypothetical protein
MPMVANAAAAVAIATRFFVSFIAVLLLLMLRLNDD